MRRGFVLLLVEDDPVLGPITAEALEIFGHATRLVATVQGAFEELSNTNFDAIILDLELGRERGETLIEKLREAGMRMPAVVILSAAPPDVLGRAQRSTGACSAFQKPIAIEDLIDELHRCIRSDDAAQDSMRRLNLPEGGSRRTVIQGKLQDDFE